MNKMTKRQTMMRPKLSDDALYLGDNGRCFCGRLRCAGMNAHFTGRDLSGQRVVRVTTETMRAADDDPALLRCETCRRGFADLVSEELL